jgi:two-component system, NarL family, nitrate/nitrite response regulator NarL
VLAGVVVEASAAPDLAVSDAGSGRVLRVVVVCAVRFMRESLAEILERDPLVSVVSQYTSLSEAVAQSPALRADIVLLDARIPEGAAAVRRALDLVPGMRIVASAIRETEDDIIAWAEAGVVGYIPSTAPLADFVSLIANIHSGEQTLSGRVATSLLRRLALSARRRLERNSSPRVPLLTQRERQAAELIRSGLSDKEIARELNISLGTTKTHVHNLLTKLNLRRRSQVADSLRE